MTYEISVFEEGKDVPNAVGGFTHVFVENASRKSTAMEERTRQGLQKLHNSVTASQAKL